MFGSKKRYKGWRCFLFRKKKMILPQSRLFLNGKEKQGQIKMDLENCKIFVNKGIFGKELYVWSGLSKIGMNLSK